MESVMTAGCCGTKKQKLNYSTSVGNSNTPIVQNGVKNGIIVDPEMGIYCFDVLYCHLHSLEGPKTPNFCNDP